MGLNIDIHVLSKKEFDYYFEPLEGHAKAVDAKGHWYDTAECDTCDGSVGDHYKVYGAYKLHDLNDYMLWRFELRHNWDNLVGTLKEVIEVIEKDIPFIREGKPLEGLVIPEGYEHGFEGFNPNTAHYLDDILKIFKEQANDKGDDHLVIYCGD